MEMGQEKRRFVRLNHLVDIVYKKSAFPTGKLSFAKNISVGGICLIAYEELKESDILDLDIYLPDDKTNIKAKGRVVWVKEFIIGDELKGRRYDAGIEFVDIKEEDVEKISKYIFRYI